MAKMIWRFRQFDYIAQHGLESQKDGVCLALAARWVKLRLKYDVGVGVADKSGMASRTEYFNKKTQQGKSAVSAVISQMQASHDEVQKPAKAELDRLDKLVDDEFQKWYDDKITRQEYDSIKADAESAAELEHQKVVNAEDVLLLRQNLIPVSRTNCNSFLEYFDGAEDDSCYIIKCKDLKHAFSIYYRKGIFWDDYHLFDPNSGEFYMDGSSQMRDFMGRLKELWKVQGAAVRIKVRRQ